MNVHRPRRLVDGAVSCAAVCRVIVAVGLLAAVVRPATAQSQGSFGRTTIDGAWNDASWVNAGGVIGPLPPSGANVFIGSAGFPSSFAQPVATVTLTGNQAAAAVTLSRQSGDSGTLSIQAGGALTTGSLSVGTSGGSGVLTVTQGGTLAVTGNLTSGGAGSATINIDGSPITAGAYLQSGPVTINRGAGGGIHAPSFSISGGTFQIQSGDSFTSSGTVGGGATASNSAAVTLSSNLSVFGAGTSYTAAAPLVLGANTTVISGGAAFNAAANVTSGGDFQVRDAASALNLNAGTFAAPSLSLFNGAAVNRSGGTYDVNILYLDTGASLSYQGADDIANSLQLVSGASFTLQKNLALTGNLRVDASTLALGGRTATVGSYTQAGASTINRGAGGGIHAPSFSISGGTFQIQSGDSFTSSGTVGGGATASNSAAVTLSSNLSVFGAGTSYTAAAPLVLGANTTVISGGAAFNAAANVTSGGDFQVRDAASALNLSAGTFAAPSLSLFNGAAVNRSGGTYDVNILYLDTGASLSYQGADDIANSLQLVSGASFTLQKNLALTGNLRVDASTLALGGRTATVGSYTQAGASTINRGAGGGIHAPSFSISGGTFQIQSGDSFTSSGTVGGGATASNSAAVTLSSNLSVFGAGTSYTAAAPLVLGANTTVISGGAAFNAAANVTSGGDFQVRDAASALNLSAGTFAAPSLSLFNGAAVNRSGGTYDVNILYLDTGASLSYQGADDIANSLQLVSGASFTLQKNLALTGNLRVDASTLALGGRTATVGSYTQAGASTINRGAGGGIHAPSFSISGGTFQIQSGDSFTSSGTVGGGATASNSAAVTLSSNLSVFGAGTSYTAAAPLVLGANTTVISGGAAFNAAANVTSGGDFQVRDAASALNLNAGTFAAPSLSLFNGAAVNRSGGTYDVNILYLDTGASLSYQGADDIANSLQLVSGASFTLQKNLALTGNLRVDASTLALGGRTATVGSYTQAGASTINRGAGGGIHAPSFSISGGTFQIQSGDSFTSSGTVGGGATASNSAAVTLSSNLSVFGAGTSYTAAAPLVLGANTTVISGGAAFNAAANVTSGGDFQVRDAASQLNLSAGTFAAPNLSLFNGAAVNRSGGTYDVNILYLDTGASLSYQGADDIANSLQLVSGASFTLQKNLALTGNLRVDASTLALGGRTATVGSYTQAGASTINRGAGGGIHAPSFSISGGTFQIQSGDSFTSSGTVGGGATASNSAAVTLSSNLSVFGAGTSYTAAAPLVLGANTTVISGGAAFNAAANVTSGGDFQVRDAASQLNLSAGTFAAPNLSLFNGAAVNAQNDVILASPLFLSSGGAVNVFQSFGDLTGLSLEGGALTIDATSSLNLAFDARRRPGALDWAFRWQGDHVAQLQALVGTRILVTGNPHHISVIYSAPQFGDFTYIGYISSVGDFDGDDDIDVADFLTLSTHLFTDVTPLSTDQSYLLGDLTGDLRVDGKDFAEFRTAYDEANGVGAFVAMLAVVPEPSTITSALVALALGLYARRR